VHLSASKLKIKIRQIPHFNFYYKICNKKNYKKQTGWGAGQPGFPCVLFRKKNYKKQTGWGAGQPGFFLEKRTTKNQRDGVRGNLGFPAGMGW